MPEFHLDLGDSDRHAAFDALPGIVQGYFEAAFFTGLSHVFPDPEGETLLADGTRGRCEEIDGLGIGNLDAESFRDMTADACRFWIENAESLEAATASGAYDLEQAGRDFWFSRNGHGVGFSDRGLGDVGDALQSAAEYQEIDLSPEPLDAADADAENPEAWRVVLCSRVAPLTETERAALERLQTGDTPPSLSRVGSRYGAPTGRRSGTLDAGETVRADRVTLDPGGYDSGGAYWGLGESLWRVTGAGSGESVFLRAATKADAIQEAAQ